MCLTIINANSNTIVHQSLIAKEDITCYKIVNYFFKDKRFVIRSFHMSFPYQLNKIEYEPLFPPVTTDYNNFVDHAFHSYKTFIIANDQYAMAPSVEVEDAAIVECIIPKGTQYYEGYHNHPDLIGYASKEIVLKRIIYQ